MALYRRPASPVAGKTSTAKKVAMAVVGKYEPGAVETKIAVAEPKVEKPLQVNRVVPKVPVAETATEEKEKKVARQKVDAKKPAEKAAVKSVAAETKAPAKKETAAKKAPAKKSAPVFMIQYQGNDITAADIEAKLAEQCKNSGIKAKNVEIYVKPEENKVYAVVDGQNMDFDLF